MTTWGWIPQLEEPGGDATVEVAGWFEPTALTVLGAGGFEESRIPLERGLTTLHSSVPGAGRIVFDLIRATLVSEPSPLFDPLELERRRHLRGSRAHKLPLEPDADHTYPWPIEVREMSSSFELDAEGPSRPCAWLELKFDTDRQFERWPNPGGANFHAGMIGWRYMTARNLMRAAMDTIDGVRYMETLTNILVDEYIAREPDLYWGDDEIPAERLLDLFFGWSQGLEVRLGREPTGEELDEWLQHCAEWAQTALEPSVDREALATSIRALLGERRQCLVRFPWGRSRYLAAPVDADYKDIRLAGVGPAASKDAFDDLSIDDPDLSRPVFVLENDTRGASHLVDLLVAGEDCSLESIQMMDEQQVQFANAFLDAMLHDPPVLDWRDSGLMVTPERLASAVPVEEFYSSPSLALHCLEIAVSLVIEPPMTTARIVLVDLTSFAQDPNIDRVLAGLTRFSRQTGAKIVVDMGDSQTRPREANCVEIRLNSNGCFEADHDRSVSA